MLNITLLQLKVLWLINTKPSCGYEIMAKLRKGGRGITQGTMYPLLQSLQKPRLIVSEKAGIRSKKTYKLTKKGKAVLQKTCKEFCNIYDEIFKKYTCKTCKCKGEN
jgi:DNA-binding PadR family transcriptional regulator